MVKTRMSNLFYKHSIKILIILIVFFGFPFPSYSYSKDTFPKLANYYLPWDIADNEAQDLAKWDLIVVHTQAVDRNSDLLQLIKQYNPNIKILAYFPSQEINNQAQTIDPNGAWGKIYNQVNSADWWLKNTGQQYLSHWPGTRLINVTNNALLKDGQRWNHWLPQFINNNYLKTNPNWDGIFYDNCWPTVDWLNFALDLNNDGQIDTAAGQNAYWSAGMTELLSYTKQIIAAEKLVVCNGGTNYRQNYQGRMFESFPLPNEGGWAKNLNDLLLTGPYSIINANTANHGNQADYQNMRFGFTSTLLGDGYYSFDSGDQNHGQKWWYDEYNAYLGKALGPARIYNNNSTSPFVPGTWQRHFENGLVLVNSANQPANIDLDNKYEKIKGQQDTFTNNGRVVNSLQLAPSDGVVLLKPLDKLVGVSFNNGSFARIFNNEGYTIRNGFFAYQKEYGGGQEIFLKDLNNDAKLETVVSDKSSIKIFDGDNNLISQFYPYGEKFAFGFQTVVDDIDNSGNWEIITVPNLGAPAHVKTFSLNGRWLNPGFFAYPDNDVSGASLAIIDINNDGQKEIITAPGRNDKSPLKIFTKNGVQLPLTINTFAKTYTGSVGLASGDINGDGSAEIIVSRKTGQAEIKIYTNAGQLLDSWTAFKSLTGVKVRTLDIDGNGKYEIITLSNELF